MIYHCPTVPIECRCCGDDGSVDDKTTYWVVVEVHDRDCGDARDDHEICTWQYSKRFQRY